VTPADSPYADLDRPPLHRAALLRALGEPWTDIEVYAEVDSTNRVCVDAAKAGRSEGLVVVAELQTGGRGRLGRQWVSPPRAGLTLSLLLRPDVPAARRSWLTALVALGATVALGERTGVDVGLKWPNDLVVDDRKLGGLLAEVAGDAVVVGLGLNVTTRRTELPRADATSLALEGAEVTDRQPLLLAILRAVGTSYGEWLRAGGEPEPLRSAYLQRCVTIGQPVRVELPDDASVEGVAVDIDDDGRLVVDTDGRRESFSAGDVVHLRPPVTG
jgi:BirA family biotin operon repressor/biotin-[acetyl-CoA-carboxylase] ligase